MHLQHYSQLNLPNLPNQGMFHQQSERSETIRPPASIHSSGIFRSTGIVNEAVANVTYEQIFTVDNRSHRVLASKTLNMSCTTCSYKYIYSCLVTVVALDF